MASNQHPEGTNQMSSQEIRGQYLIQRHENFMFTSQNSKENINDGIGIATNAFTGSCVEKAVDMCNNTENRRRSITGFAVNGFHPQLTSLQQNLDLLELNAVEPSTALFSPFKNIGKVNETIGNLVASCRTTEQNNARKRQEVTSNFRRNGDSFRPLKRSRCVSRQYAEAQASNPNKEMLESSTSSLHCVPPADLYDDIFLQSAVPQIIATPGGKVTSWNAEFVKLLQKSSVGLTSYLTVFDLVKPSMVPNLFDIFALALRDDSAGSMADVGRSLTLEKSPTSEDVIVCDSKSVPTSSLNPKLSTGNRNSQVEKDTEDSTHVSIILPCIPFSTTKTQHHITVTLMNDIDPALRCFHCIISSKHPNRLHIANGKESQISSGIIHTVHQQNLARLL